MGGFTKRGYGQNLPLVDVFPFPIFKTRAPGSNDKNYLVGQVWVYKINATTRAMYMFGGLNSSKAPIWSQLSSGTGDLSTLTGTSGGAIAPIASNINFAAGTGIASIVGTAGTITFNVNFASPPAIGSGTPAAITGTTVASTGAMTAGTGLTATTGNITASAGNLVLNGAAKQIQIHGGAVTDFIGQATLALGTVSIANTNIASGDKILVQRHGINGSSALGVFNVAISAGASFSITALKPADGTTETGDISIVDYVIVRQV